MKTFGELFRERIIEKPSCFGEINFESEKCGKCHVVGQCFIFQGKESKV